MKMQSTTALLLVLSLSIHSQERIPLIEEFSSSTCPPCATFSKSVFTPFLTNTANQGKFTCVAYRMNWPGKGDKYYTAEAGKRRDLYGVKGVPDCYIDSKAVPDNGMSSLQQFTSNFTAACGKPAKLAVTAKHSITGATPTAGSVQSTVTITPKQDITDGLLFVAVVEKLTKGNVGTNGEKEFHHVFMKMIPDAEGKAVTLKANNPEWVTQKGELKGTFIEEMNDLEVIVWVQSKNTKEIFQSAYSKEDVTPVERDKSNKKIVQGMVTYNASKSEIMVLTKGSSKVSLFSVSGRLIAHRECIDSRTFFDVSRYFGGCYIVQISNDEGIFLLKKIEIVK